MTDTISAPARSIIEVLDDCQKWYSETLLSLFYGDTSQWAASNLPKLYSEWINSPFTNTTFRQRVLEPLRLSGEKLNTTLQDAKKSNPPDQSAFQNFVRAYEAFMITLNGIQCEFVINSKDVDVQTGFKSSYLVLPEIKREFERRGRQGNSFSIIMIRIEAGDGAEENENRVRAMAMAVNQCLRGFDDVYRLNDTDILISLKVTDIKGGLRFVERLKGELKTLNAEFTFSSCVAEPDPASDITRFLKELEDDLSTASTHGGGQTIKYEDISPMQRFIANMKERTS